MIARPMVRTRLAGAALLLAAAWPGRVAAQYSEVPAPAAYALTGVTIVQADGRRSPGVTVVVRDGFIEAIGAGVEVPADARVIEGDSLVVYPGLVDAHGSVKFEFPSVELDRSRIQSWDPPREAQGFTPHRRVVDVLEATGQDVAEQRRNGVVAAAVHPTDALMPGRGVLLVLRPDAATPRELVHTPVLGPVLTLRGGRGTYPATLFGVLAFYRQSFEDASRMRLIAAEYAKDPRGVPAPGYDPDYAVLQEVIGGGTPVHFAVDRAADIHRALDLSARYRLRPVIVGGGEAWRVADRLKAAGAPVLVSLDFPKPERWKPEAEAEPPDSATAAQELDPAILREKRRIEDGYANAGRLADAGVRIALTSGGGKADLLAGARRAIEYGLSEAAALRALTSAPAELLGIPHVTRIEPGLPATFIVVDGPLFEKETKIVYTLVEGVLEKAAGGGEENDGDEEPAVDVSGGWDVELASAEGTVGGTMSLRQDGPSFSGTITTAEFGAMRVLGGRVAGNRITFTVAVDAGGEAIEVRLSGTAEGDTLSARGPSPYGEVEFTARRTPGPRGGLR